MTRRRLLIAGWLLALALSASLPLSALLHGVIHLGGTYVVQNTSRPLVALDSRVVLPRGSHTITVSLFGDIQVYGRVHDDLVAVAGNIFLHPGAHVDGDIVTAGGATYQGGKVTTTGRIGGALYSWNGAVPAHHSVVATVVAGNVRLGLAAGLALMLIGICLAVVFPWQLVLIATTLRTSPWKSLLAGAMNLLIFVFLVVPLGLSLAGLPFALLLTGAAGLAWLFGLTAGAVIVGRLLAHGAVSLLWATAAGLMVAALALAVPVLGPLLILGAGLTGAGALAVALLERGRPHEVGETF